VFEVERPTTVEEVNSFLKEAADTYLKGILGYEEQPLVSTDYVNDARSSIVDAISTQVRMKGVANFSFNSSAGSCYV
jgi:glyceraldehyde 3-phosphate dehydrogenase